jgi:hypothetical protein
MPFAQVLDLVMQSALPFEVWAVRPTLESSVVVHKGLYKKGAAIVEAAGHWQ